MTDETPNMAFLVSPWGNIFAAATSKYATGLPVPAVR